jgi:hypothetical protein
MTQEQLFNLFVSDYDIDCKTLKPFELNGYVYATDKHIIIRCKKEHVDFPAQILEDPLKADGVFLEHNTNKQITFNDIDFELYKDKPELELKGADIYCRECNGEGEVVWEYGRWEKEFECPACDGDGYESKSDWVETGNKTFGYYMVSINDVNIDIKYIWRLKLLSDITSQPIIMSRIENPKKGVTFCVSNYEVVVMPLFKFTDEFTHKLIASYLL